jgi:hypothetical protein
MHKIPFLKIISSFILAIILSFGIITILSNPLNADDVCVSSQTGCPYGGWYGNCWYLWLEEGNPYCCCLKKAAPGPYCPERLCWK